MGNKIILKLLNGIKITVISFIIIIFTLIWADLPAFGEIYFYFQFSKIGAWFSFLAGLIAIPSLIFYTSWFPKWGKITLITIVILLFIQRFLAQPLFLEERVWFCHAKLFCINTYNGRID